MNDDDVASILADEELLSLATPQELEAIRVALEARRLNGTFREFVVAADPRFIIYRHCELIIDKLQQLYDGDFNKLLVQMPPRHSKSYLGTLLFPAFYLHNNPDHNLILTACSADLARGKFSVELREFMQQPPINMEFGATKGKDIWRTENGGSVLAVGSGGTMIGYGAQLFIIDDPVRTRDEAASPLMQSKLYDWYQSVLVTREEPNAKTVFIMQRWHDQDLAGRILETEGDSWEVLSLPAIANDEDDPLGRELGEALCPERYPLSKLQERQTEMGHTFFEAMYQQNPVPEGGAMFKSEYARYFEYVDSDLLSLDGRIVDLNECVHFLACDLAQTTGRNSDFSVIMHVAVDKNGDLMILQIKKGKWKATRTEKEILDATTAHPNIRFVVIERSVGSIPSIEQIQPRFPVRDPAPTTKKSVRAIPAQVHQERGKIWTPNPDEHHWVVEFEHELYRFPASKNDDQVDALSWAVMHIKEGGGDGAFVTAAGKPMAGPPIWTSDSQPRPTSKLFPWMN